MNRLVIEYVFEGHRRGYNFTSSTAGFSDDVLKAVWRGAMPRGQGWGKPAFSGARSIKCFQLPDARIAVSEVTVTDLEDEHGRRGIRHAVVDIMPPRVFGHHLESRLAGYPAGIRTETRTLYAKISKRLPRQKKDAPLVLAHPYSNSNDWWVIEALVLELARQPVGWLRRVQSGIVPFTTLGLNHHDETGIVALPAEQAALITDVTVLDCS